MNKEQIVSFFWMKEFGKDFLGGSMSFIIFAPNNCTGRHTCKLHAE